MKASTTVCITACFLVFSASASTSIAGSDPNGPALRQDPQLAEILEAIRQKYDLPAVAGAIVTSDGIERIAAAGVRKRGTDIPVALNDQWHLGSDTKAMTATLIAILVEEGKLDWDMSLQTLFPEQAQKGKGPNRDITIRQLLHHRSGLPANLNWRSYSNKGSLRRQRLLVAEDALKADLEHAPGEKYLYSNLGYTVLGAVIEKVTDQSWEAAIEQKIFKPLNMSHCGFGGTGTTGKIDQPWPHGEDGSPMPSNGPQMDNALVLAPAGCVHCTLEDWSRYIADLLLGGSNGKKTLLRPDMYALIQTPPDGGDYGFGWIVCQRPWAGGTALNHAGSNTMNYAVAWVAPKKDFAVLLCTNQGGSTPPKALDEAAGEMIRLATTSNEDHH